MNTWNKNIYEYDDKIDDIAVKFQRNIKPSLNLLMQTLKENNCGFDTFYAIVYDKLSEEIVNMILEERLKGLKLNK